MREGENKESISLSFSYLSLSLSLSLFLLSSLPLSLSPPLSLAQANECAAGLVSLCLVGCVITGKWTVLNPQCQSPRLVSASQIQGEDTRDSRERAEDNRQPGRRERNRNLSGNSSICLLIVFLTPGSCCCCSWPILERLSILTLLISID